jgi:hypothetical protein
VRPGRRDEPRRVTPELLAFHKKRAHRLRDKAWRNLLRRVGASLKKIFG